MEKKLFSWFIAETYFSIKTNFHSNSPGACYYYSLPLEHCDEDVLLLANDDHQIRVDRLHAAASAPRSI